MSLSSRRAWIEILITEGGVDCYKVALLTESVDRNFLHLGHGMISHVALLTESVDGRSPHGERG